MYHEAYVVPHPDGLWSRLHTEVAVLEDDVLVGHRLAVIAALPSGRERVGGHGALVPLQGPGECDCEHRDRGLGGALSGVC